MALNNWTQESKARLSEKVQGNITDMSQLVKQMIKNSKSGDHIEKAAKNFSSQEGVIEASSLTMKRMWLLVSNMQYLGDEIEKSLAQMDVVQDQVTTILHR